VISACCEPVAHGSRRLSWQELDLQLSQLHVDCRRIDVPLLVIALASHDLPTADATRERVEGRGTWGVGHRASRRTGSMNSSPVLLRIVRQVTRSPTHRTSLGCSDTRTDSSTLQCVAITAMRCSIIAFCISIFRATVSSRCSTNIRASRMYMCTVPRSRCACALSCACLNSTSSRMSRFRSSAIRLFIGQMQAHHPPHLGAMAISVRTACVVVRALGENVVTRAPRAARTALTQAKSRGFKPRRPTTSWEGGTWKKAEVGSRRLNDETVEKAP